MFSIQILKPKLLAAAVFGALAGVFNTAQKNKISFHLVQLKLKDVSTGLQLPQRFPHAHSMSSHDRKILYMRYCLFKRLNNNFTALLAFQWLSDCN